MTNQYSSIIAFDGHDGCGKSTLAAAVADRLGGCVVKPFGDTLGDHIAWLWRHERFEEADALARASVDRVTHTTAIRPLVFDRHWATMFSVLPDRFRERWQPLPVTVICRADTPVVMARLAERGEPAGDAGQHDYFDKVYVGLAAANPRTFVLDTTAAPHSVSLERVMVFLRDVPADERPGSARRW
jgi:thymidylate kinase